MFICLARRPGTPQYTLFQLLFVGTYWIFLSEIIEATAESREAETFFPGARVYQFKQKYKPQVKRREQDKKQQQRALVQQSNTNMIKQNFQKMMWHLGGN